MSGLALLTVPSGARQADAPHGRAKGMSVDSRPVSLLHFRGMLWTRIGELLGRGDLVTTARTYTHVVADEAELDYEGLLGARV